jgi:Domain of unknown function (DUF1707)
MTRRALLRASDADREQVTERLRQAATEGRLHDDELEERLGAALCARTYGELDALVADLPEPVPSRRPAPGRVRVPALAVALAVALTIVSAIVGVVSGGGHEHGYHHWGVGLGGGTLVWLLWIALAWRLFLHGRGRAR